MAEEVVVGDVAFELDVDGDGGFVVSVRKADDLEGWITFVPCPDDEFEWSELRNKCFPFNGRSSSPPLGQWVVFEFVGKDTASLNLGGDRADRGFTDDELVLVTAMVNLAYKSLQRRAHQTEREKHTKAFTH